MVKKLLDSRLIAYLCVAIFVTMIDFSLTLGLKRLGLFMLLSNTIGMVVGSITQFFLLYKYVYKVKISWPEFLKFESTFLIGLVISNVIVTITYNVLNLSAAVSKGFTIILTFFIIYTMREWMMRRKVAT